MISRRRADGVVGVAAVADDPVGVDADEGEVDARVVLAAGQPDLAELPAERLSGLATWMRSWFGSMDSIEPWLSAASRVAVSPLSAGTFGTSAASSSVLTTRSSARNACVGGSEASLLLGEPVLLPSRYGRTRRV